MPSDVRSAGPVHASSRRWRPGGITGEPAEGIRLCVSELASNALAHGTRRGHGFLMRVRADEDSVRLEVHDSRDMPSDRQPLATDTDTAGRGLSLVDTLADDWGCRRAAPVRKSRVARFRAAPAPQPV
ncbi:ATP-binding protein [Streptomyces sp. NPDC020330]|uniref:ATP-binding protein n=1 Tax=unclassified Streptomyces TaxID=2593676 RepID=UPI0037909A77